ncbi:MAG: Inner membrane protein, KefB/KefC family [uncultured Sphingomonas sp.]|uniref:Inner membrane protein, KefB/KefC family n=1 Tax=uncultured Sphingomonas sp. TaxID=158754 RepID=A0A6J4SKR2_9SPHN|nr:MAG: Inner membrane protein, KefB/KefC family [uncultured Sphingomonas sp.]
MTGEDFSTSGFSDALVILGAAGIVIPAFARIRISPVIGFILIGFIVGPFGLGSLSGQVPWLNYVTISNPEAIEPFAELGIVLLLFSIGLELSFRRLWSMRRLVFGVGGAELIGIAALIGLGLHLMGQSPAGAIGLGLALALSSTALVIPLVGTHSAVGRSALGMLLFEDVALVPIVFALGAMAPFAASNGVGSLVTTMVIGGAAAVAMLVLGRFLLPPLFAQAARTKSPELFLSACLLVVIIASLITSAIGFSLVLGALIAGIVIAETDYRSEVEVVTAPFRGLGLGIFLITVGMSVSPLALMDNWQALLAALVAVLALKALVTAVLLRLNGAPTAVAAETGVLMASPSETTLIVLTAAMAAQLIQPQTAAFWQTVTALGLTITPLLARLGRMAGKRVAGQELAGKLEASLETAELGQVIIFGFGRVGRLVADMMESHGKDYLAVDSDTDCVSAARAEGYDVLFGEAGHVEFLDRLAQRQPAAFILTMDNPVLVGRLTRSLRAMFPDLPIIARARDTAHAATLYRAGATDAVPETLEASLQLSEAALVDLGVAMGPVIASIHEKRAALRSEIMTDAELAEAPRLGRRRLRDSVRVASRTAPSP